MAMNVLEKVYETLLCSPGMNEAVKVDVKINRKVVLLLSSVIETGLAPQGDKEVPGLLQIVPKEAVEELRQFTEDCLKKAGLTELSEKMRSLAK
ncbi:hypothetical protein [Mucilaginibacter terrae]|uniref:Uncharacterized protein n=1 Tax=Mucilaginibacter terrae TaxID=1955052 RepID=A0ABU3GS27_9SPHI|nr:hypothetical protein [Mucilaginibacter terrae]MDT3402276.1 hypothetical protein [Mucilaginibacter terrae]